MPYQPEVPVNDLPLNPDIAPSREQIERRAYEIYIARGGEDGHDLVDWIMAEQELTTIARVAAATPRRSDASTRKHPDASGYPQWAHIEPSSEPEN